MNVLIGEIGSYKAIVIAKYLKTNYPNLTIFTFDYLYPVCFIHSKYSDGHFHLKSKAGKQYVQELAILCQKNLIDVFIPVHSDNIGAILKEKHLFGKSLNYMGDYYDYLRLHNKYDLQAFAKKVGIDTPDSFLTFDSAKIPFVLKPVNKSSSKGVRYFKTIKSKKTFNFNNEDQVIIQEFVEGFGCGYSVFVKDGTILTGYGHKRLAEIPVSGGSSVYRSSFFDPRMKSIAEKIFRHIPWSGFAMIEFKYTQNNRLVLIEVNPRIWGSINQGLQCGINYFEHIFGNPKKVVPPKEVNTYLSPQIYLSLVRYIFQFEFKPLIFFLSKINNNKADLSLSNDPKGYLSVILRKILK